MVTFGLRYRMVRCHGVIHYDHFVGFHDVLPNSRILFGVNRFYIVWTRNWLRKCCCRQVLLQICAYFPDPNLNIPVPRTLSVHGNVLGLNHWRPEHARYDPDRVPIVHLQRFPRLNQSHVERIPQRPWYPKQRSYLSHLGPRWSPSRRHLLPLLQHAGLWRSSSSRCLDLCHNLRLPSFPCIFRDSIKSKLAWNFN